MFRSSIKRRYFDHASGTPVDSDVYKKMKPYFISSFYNSGGIYKEGVEVNNAINKARRDVAGVLKSRPEEIIFVDGGTEANNLAILGSVRSWQKSNSHKVAHVITSRIEHASVLETCRVLQQEGVEVTYLNVNDQGIIDLKELKESIKENTVIISIGYVNGEIGVIQDIRSIMKTIRHYKKHNNSMYPYMHTDAVQAVNYVETIGVPQLGVDLMTINASKIYGPKKIAVLFVKAGSIIDPIIYGGNQERGLRSGTENVPYIVGMAQSLLSTRKLQSTEKLRLEKLQEYTTSKMHQLFDDIIINAENVEKIPNIVNVTFQNISHEEIVIRLDARGIMCSVKSACKAGEDGDSHVISSLRNSNKQSVRFSFGRGTTKTDIDYMLKELKNIVEGMKETLMKYQK